MRTGILLALLAVAAGCDGSVFDTSVEIAGAEDAPPEALVTDTLFYERIDLKMERIDNDVESADLDLDDALITALDPGAFARFVHVTDAQIREERGLLLNAAVTKGLEWVSDYYTPPEGTKRQALQEVNSPFVWVAMVLTLMGIHDERPIDFTIHTGDAVDIGLRSELTYYLAGASELPMPFLDIAGNHDVFTFGNFSTAGSLYGLGLDTEIEVHASAQDAFLANGEELLQPRSNYARIFREIADGLGDHTPTVDAFGSTRYGHDLAADPDGLFYAATVKAPAGGQPGLRVICLETSRDDAGHGAEIPGGQLGFLNDELDKAATRASLVVVCAHHPVIELHRNDDDLGTVVERKVSEPLMEVWRILCHYPNVVLYLCGHTHLPDLHEEEGGTDVLKWVQFDSGSLLVAPQQATVIELRVDATDVEVFARRFGAMIDPDCNLGKRVQEGITAAWNDRQSAPRYTPWQEYRRSRPLPTFPVTVAKYVR